MPPRRAVTGPTSALTNFLAGLGVEPSSLVRNGAPADANGAADAGPSSGPGTGMGSASPSGSATPSGSAAYHPAPDYDSDDLDAVRPAKRVRRLGTVDSDDLDATDGPSGTATPGSGDGAAPADLAPGARVRPSSRKAIGEFMNCGECAKQFTVTAYTKEHPTRPRNWLCVACCPALGVDAFARPKKAVPKRPAAPKAQRGKIVHYEESKGPKPLAEMCIKIIGKYIEEVEALGDIGFLNLDKVCRIICKSRRLTAETAKLFYSVDRTDLSLYDCTNLVHESYLTLAKLNPNLTSLNLQMCGQLSTQTLSSWAKTLPNLTKLELNGPFLVRKEGWADFINARGAKLQELKITQSPRIDLATIELLAKKCKSLKVLQLSEVGKMSSDFLVPLAKLSKLESLTITCPGDKLVVEAGDGTPLSDDAVESLLAKIGGNLTHLNLGYNKELSGAVMVGIAKYCKKLTSLSLHHSNIEPGKLAEYFGVLKSADRPGLTYIDLEKGHDLADEVLEAIIEHSGHSLKHLSIHGWRNVSADAVAKLARCPQLSYLDIGWCRHVTDFTVKDILDGCGHIETVRVWGCNQLTDRVPRKKGVRVVGIESHAI